MFGNFLRFLSNNSILAQILPTSSSDSLVMLNYPITEREKDTNNDIVVQADIPCPETNLTANILGKRGCFLSVFIHRQGDNPPLKEIMLYSYSMSKSKWVELFQFTSTCKYLMHLNLWSCNLGEAGRSLAQSITSWGDNPPLQRLYLNRCSIPKQVWPELLQSLSSCKQLSDLNLSSNTIGEAGRHLAQSITSWGDNPPLQELRLFGCSIPKHMWPELLQSLSSCKQLTHLDVSYNTIGEAGRYLAQSITSWGDNPPLRKLDLRYCSIPKQVWPELLQSLSSCKQLAHLDLSHNTIGEAGRHLAQSITSWGDDPPLHRLDLGYCSILKQVWPELLQSLSSCKQLAHLDLSRNTIGEAGRYLAQSIKSWGDDPHLEALHLNPCSIPEQVWPELLQSLSSCKQLTDLDLSDNTIGEAGRSLAQSITSWGHNPPLRKLDLIECSIPEQVWPELLQSLSSCKQLTDLDLSDNTIGEAGRSLAQSIKSWGDDPPLQKLILSDCSIPEQVWAELLQSLSSCRKLADLSGNTLTGCLSSFLSDPNPGLTSLKDLNLEQTKLNKSDIQHLTHLIQNKKLSGLKHLWLEVWRVRTGVLDELLQLKDAWSQEDPFDSTKNFC